MKSIKELQNLVQELQKESRLNGKLCNKVENLVERVQSAEKRWRGTWPKNLAKNKARYKAAEKKCGLAIKEEKASHDRYVKLRRQIESLMREVDKKIKKKKDAAWKRLPEDAQTELLYIRSLESEIKDQSRLFDQV